MKKRKKEKSKKKEKKEDGRSLRTKRNLNCDPDTSQLGRRCRDKQCERRKRTKRRGTKISKVVFKYSVRRKTTTLWTGCAFCSVNDARPCEARPLRGVQIQFSKGRYSEKATRRELDDRGVRATRLEQKTGQKGGGAMAGAHKVRPGTPCEERRSGGGIVPIGE